MTYRNREVIGTYTVTEPIIRRKRYEFAAWWTDVRVEPGTYDVSVRRTPEGRISMVDIHLHGTVVDAYFPSSFGGKLYGGSNKDRHIGTTETCGFTAYPFQLTDGGSLEDERAKMNLEVAL